MTPPLLVALDPGTRHAGLAIFRLGRLVEAFDLATNRASSEEMITEVWCALAHVVPTKAALVSEWPRGYRTRRRAHADLDGLRRVVEGTEAAPWASTARTSPSGWKGQVPKPIHHRRIAGLLDSRETAVWVGLGPDGRDAVGLGLWALRRGR